LSAEKTSTVARMIAATLDRLIEATEHDESVSFAALVRKAGLNPARDFIGAFLADIDFRDEDLRGFDFSGADLTGADFRRANIAGVRFDGAILKGALGLPTGEPGSHSEEYRNVQRAQPSGRRLSPGQAGAVKGMLLRGDRQHDIAGWFGVNPGRIAEVKDGHLYPDVPPAPPHQLPPQVPPGTVALEALVALAQVRRALEDGPRGAEKAKKIIDSALGNGNGDGRLKRLIEANLEEWGMVLRDNTRGNND
jgi:uncharacterized protein YjbI with pentapeptide repeats